MNQSIADKVRESFNFEVNKLPLFGPENTVTPYYGLFRSDTGEVASRSTFSRQYHPHTTDDVVALVEAGMEAFDGEATNVDTAFENGHHVIIAPSKEHRLSIFGSKDDIYPRLRIRGSYDGKSFSVSLCSYRDMCSNLMIFRKVNGIEESIRHSSHLRDSMDDLIETFGGIAARWKNIGEAAREMENRNVRLADFLDRIYGSPDERSRAGITRHRNRTEAIVRRLMRERMQAGRPELNDDMIVTGWEAYNAVQGYVQHDVRRKGSPNDVERSLIALRNQYVATAERLAYEMAI
jgi:hypothetical protein